MPAWLQNISEVLFVVSVGLLVFRKPFLNWIFQHDSGRYLPLFLTGWAVIEVLLAGFQTSTSSLGFLFSFGCEMCVLVLYISLAFYGDEGGEDDGPEPPEDGPLDWNDFDRHRLSWERQPVKS